MNHRPATTGFLPGLDGLRLLSALAVIACHCVRTPLFERIGAFGVDVFFSLSGFLITRLLLAEREALGRISLANFYARRCLRIWPVYFAALAICVLGAAFLGSQFLVRVGYAGTFHDLLAALAPYACFLSNWSLRPVPTPLDVLWSVAIEEQFYLVFPALLVLVRGRRPALLPAMAGLVVAWLVRYRLAASGRLVEVHLNTFAHADNLLVGALLAQASASSASIEKWAGRVSLSLEAAVLLGTGLWLSWDPSHGSPFAWVSYQAASALLTTSIVGAIAFGRRGLLGNLLARRTFVALGGLTYACYVFHQYAVALAWGIVGRLPLESALAIAIRFTIAVPCALAIAWLVKVTFEDRIRRLKVRFDPSRRPLTESQDALMGGG